MFVACLLLVCFRFVWICCSRRLDFDVHVQHMQILYFGVAGALCSLHRIPNHCLGRLVPRSPTFGSRGRGVASVGVGGQSTQRRSVADRLVGLLLGKGVVANIIFAEGPWDPYCAI